MAEYGREMTDMAFPVTLAEWEAGREARARVLARVAMIDEAGWWIQVSEKLMEPFPEGMGGVRVTSEYDDQSGGISFVVNPILDGEDNGGMSWYEWKTHLSMEYMREAKERKLELGMDERWAKDWEPACKNDLNKSGRMGGIAMSLATMFNMARDMVEWGMDDRFSRGGGVTFTGGESPTEVARRMGREETAAEMEAAILSAGTGMALRKSVIGRV